MKYFVSNTLSAIISIVLLYAAVSKLINLDFTSAVTSKEIVSLYNLEMVFTPTIELIISVLILIPKTRRMCFLVTTLMFPTFTLYIIYQKYILYQPICSCGGVISKLTFTQHVLLNISLTIISALGYTETKLNSIRKKANNVILKRFLILPLFSLLTLMGCSTSPENLTPFTIQLTNGIYMKSSDISADGGLAILYFSANCPICKELISQLKKKQNSLSVSRIVLLTSSALNETKQTLKTLEIDTQGKIIAGVDSGSVFLKENSVDNVPKTFLYNNQKKLLSVYYGNFDIEYLNQFKQH